MQVRRAKRMVWIGIMLVVLFATGGPTVAQDAAEPQLLAHATKVIRPPMDAAGYQWLSQDTILFYALHGETGWQAARVNVTTGHVTAFQGSQYIHNPGPPAASPDGKWIAGYDHGGAAVACSLTGNHIQHWNTDSPIYSRWLEDNHHWLEVIFGPNPHEMCARIHDLNDPDKQGPIVHGDPETVIGLTANRHMVCVLLNTDRKMRISNYDLTGAQPTHRTWITLPYVGILGDTNDALQPLIVLSPSGDRIAYVFWHEKNPLSPALRAQGYKYDPTGLDKTSLWISHTDGTQMHEVGAVPIEKPANGTSVPYQLKWLPDRKHLSFMLHGDLYTVPVN